MTFTAGKRTELGLAAGLTGFLVAEAGKLTDGGVGAFADAHGTRWFTPAFGLTAAGAVRVADSGTGYPSLSAGVTLRF